MEPSTAPFSVGILGCAKIARKNCRAAKAALCQVTAVASRSKEKAEGFINEILSDQKESTKIFSGGDAYDQLLDSNLHSVYIPLPCKLHEQYVARALSSKKHVLLEKPVATSAQSYKEMLDTASKNGTFLMDGTMFVHHPRTLQFIKSIPNPNRVSFNFTFYAGTNFFGNDIRTKKDGDFMGCIGDLGWYCVRMGLLVFTGSDAAKVIGLVTEVQVVRYRLNEEGVPIDADCIVHCTEDRVLSFHCSFLHALNQIVTISGTGCENTATMTDPILPRPGDMLSFTLVKQGLVQYDEITMEEIQEMQCDNTNVQEVCMWTNFARMAQKIEEESSSDSSIAEADAQNEKWSLAKVDAQNEKWWAGDSVEVKEANAIASYSLHTQIVLDALMRSIELGGTRVSL